MKCYKKNVGITLISLIVTIIIMMILAGVTINLITGNDGVINEAKEARRQTELADLKERIQIAILQVEAKVNSPTIDDVTQQLIESGVIENASQVDTSTGDITVGNHVIEGMLGEYVGAEYKQYYGENVIPTNQKYFTFEINEDGKTATITGIKDEYAVKGYYEGYFPINRAINDNGTHITEVVIPYQYIDEDGNKYPVTVLGTFVFGSNDGINGARDYGDEYDEMFSKIILPDTITKINECAFIGAVNVTEMNIPKSVKIIEDYAFSMTNIREVTGLENVEVFGRGAFYECISLSRINIPDTVSSIGWGAFCYWTETQTINCEAVSQPSGWDSNWKSGCNATVVWGVSM